MSNRAEKRIQEKAERRKNPVDRDTVLGHMLDRKKEGILPGKWLDKTLRKHGRY